MRVWVILAIVVGRSSSVGPQESITKGKRGLGRVEAVGQSDDQADVVVESFGAAVVHPEDREPTRDGGAVQRRLGPR